MLLPVPIATKNIAAIKPVINAVRFLPKRPLNFDAKRPVNIGGNIYATKNNDPKLLVFLRSSDKSIPTVQKHASTNIIKNENINNGHTLFHKVFNILNSIRMPFFISTTCFLLLTR